MTSFPSAAPRLVAQAASTPQFDPRQVPRVAPGTVLPAIAAARQTPAALRARFATPPAWQPEVRGEAPFTDRAPAQAAVLLPLVLRDELMLLLTERTAHLSTHGGQIAFPGGRQDPEDADAVATALREAQEEVGLDREQVEVLGTLPHYVTGSMFTVTPVVGLVRADAVFAPNPSEVAQVFEVPLRFVLDPVHHHQHRWTWQGQTREWFAMPYDDAGVERYIWGATAGMLRNFYRFMAA